VHTVPVLLEICLHHPCAPSLHCPPPPMQQQQAAGHAGGPAAPGWPPAAADAGGAAGRGEWVGGWVGGQVGGRVGGQVGGWVGGQVGGWVGGYVGEWVGGWAGTAGSSHQRCCLQGQPLSHRKQLTIMRPTHSRVCMGRRRCRELAQHLLVTKLWFLHRHVQATPSSMPCRPAQAHAITIKAMASSWCVSLCAPSPAPAAHGH
jgi:hypothetical protein